MATVNYEIVTDKVNYKVVKWAGLANGDVGQAVEMPGYIVKSFQVKGTFGSGGKVAIEGSIDPTPAWRTLNDRYGVPAEFTEAGIKEIGEATPLIRPNVAAGDGNTDLTVYAFLVS